MKSALSEGHPIVGTFRVFKSLEKNSDGFVKMPTDEELTEKEEFHAMVICGYNDSGKYFIVRNSWGEYFGDHGYCYLPYAYVRDAQLTRSMFIVNMGIPSERLKKEGMKSHISSHHDTPWFNYELNLNLLREEQLALNNDRSKLTQNIDKLKSVLESILNDDIEDVILHDFMQRKEAMIKEEEQQCLQLEHLNTKKPVKQWYKLVSVIILVSGLASGITWYFSRETWQIIVGIVLLVTAIILFAFTIGNSKQQKALTTRLEELRSDLVSIDKEISDKKNTIDMLRHILMMVNEYDAQINDWRQYINESSDKLYRWKNIFDNLHNADGLTNQTQDVDENLLEDMINIVFNDEDKPLSDKFKKLQEKILRKLNGLYDSQISDHLNPSLKSEWKDYVETIARLCASAELNAGPSESLMTILTDLIDRNSLEDITIPNNVILYSNKLLTFAVLEKEITIGQIKIISL